MELIPDSAIRFLNFCISDRCSAVYPANGISIPSGANFHHGNSEGAEKIKSGFISCRRIAKSLL